jgi:hypothetical protein
MEVTAVMIFGHEAPLQLPMTGLDPDVVSDAISLVLFCFPI